MPTWLGEAVALARHRLRGRWTALARADEGTSWRVREDGGAMALMPWCYAFRTGLVRLVGRLPVGMGALSDTEALGDRGTSALQRSCSTRDEGRR